jgi:hypothetical protein
LRPVRNNLIKKEKKRKLASKIKKPWKIECFNLYMIRSISTSITERSFKGKSYFRLTVAAH